MKSFSAKQNQHGSALILVLVVLVAITVLTTASMQDNNMQIMLVKNNQYRLEAFNSSHAEIEAQMEDILERPLVDGPPPFVQEFANNGVGTTVSTAADEIALLTPAPSVTKSTTIVFHGGCYSSGSSINLNECQRLRIDAASEIDNTDVSSVQHQLYDYELAKSN